MPTFPYEIPLRDVRREFEHCPFDGAPTMFHHQAAGKNYVECTGIRCGAVTGYNYIEYRDRTIYVWRDRKDERVGKWRENMKFVGEK